MGVERLATLSNFMCSTTAVNKAPAEPKEEGPIRTRPRRTLGHLIEGLRAGRSAWIPVLVFCIGTSTALAMVVNGVHMLIKLSL